MPTPEVARVQEVGILLMTPDGAVSNASVLSRLYYCLNLNVLQVAVFLPIFLCRRSWIRVGSLYSALIVMSGGKILA